MCDLEGVLCCASASLNDIFRAVCADFGVALEEFNGGPEHVRPRVRYPPKVRPSELVNSLKARLNSIMQARISGNLDLWSVRKSKGALWSASYFARSVGGEPISILRQYIEFPV